MCCLSSIRQTPAGQLPEHNCFEPLVAWIRASEAEEGVQKVVALAIAFFASLILCVSIIGAPLFLMAHEEYVLQELQPRFRAIQEAGELPLTTRISGLEALVAKQPDPDDENIGDWGLLDNNPAPVLPTKPPAAVKGAKAPPPPSKEDLIQILQARVRVLHDENQRLKVVNRELEAVKENPLGARTAMGDRATTLLPNSVLL